MELSYTWWAGPSLKLCVWVLVCALHLPAKSLRDHELWWCLHPGDGVSATAGQVQLCGRHCASAHNLSWPGFHSSWSLRPCSSVLSPCSVADHKWCQCRMPTLWPVPSKIWLITSLPPPTTERTRTGKSCCETCGCWSWLLAFLVISNLKLTDQSEASVCVCVSTSSFGMQIPAGSVQGLLSSHRELFERRQSQKWELLGQIYKILPEAGVHQWHLTLYRVHMCICIKIELQVGMDLNAEEVMIEMVEDNTWSL